MSFQRFITSHKNKCKMYHLVPLVLFCLKVWFDIISVSDVLRSDECKWGVMDEWLWIMTVYMSHESLVWTRWIYEPCFITNTGHVTCVSHADDPLQTHTHTYSTTIQLQPSVFTCMIELCVCVVKFLMVLVILELS